MVVTIALSPATFDARVEMQYYMLQDVAAPSFHGPKTGCFRVRFPKQSSAIGRSIRPRPADTACETGAYEVHPDPIVADGFEGMPDRA